MHKLIIEHIPTIKKESVKVRVSYRKSIKIQPISAVMDFNFLITNDQYRSIQWYLEEYLLFPWGKFVNRAKNIEIHMVSLGEELFQAVFENPNTSALYAKVVNDLAHTNIIIHASDPAGISIPWELMRDPVHQEYGSLGFCAPALGAAANAYHTRWTG